MPRNLRTLSSAVLLGGVFLLPACGGEGGKEPAAKSGGAGGDTGQAASTAAASGPGSTSAASSGPVTDNGPKANLPPNELGRIMVLEYHRLGNNETEFVRRQANFQKDLETLYAKGYRPITMRDLMDGNVNVPAGTTPVVFTIDDSSLGQFYYLPNGQIDPNTMMGMWSAFQKKNPGWRNGAVWCILPAAAHPSNFFGEKPDKQVPRAQREANIRKKVEYLVQNGHEVCNHTLYHARLDKARDDAQAQEWIGRGEDSLKVYLPQNYDIVTFALPLGMWPKNRALAWRGSWKGKPYENRVVLEVSGGPNVSPYDRAWDPHSVDRFIVSPGALERQLQHWDKDPSNRFVSDGDPNTVTVPQRLAGQVDQNRTRGKTVKTVADNAPAAR